MSEKEIKPATTAEGGVKIATDPNAPTKSETGPSKSSTSGSIRYPDGYKMERDESGGWYLDKPGGGQAYWDPGSETWKDLDGNTRSEGWSGGHRPPKYETGPSEGL